MGEKQQIVFSVITVSDTCAKDPSQDRSGPKLVQLIEAAFKNVKILNNIVADETEDIKNILRHYVEEHVADIIITTGGSGFAPRDRTPEATLQVIQKQCPQLTMAIALYSLQKTKFAALTRGITGIAGKSLIMNFPGSEKAVAECFEAVTDILPHAVNLIGNDLELVKQVHSELQNAVGHDHNCPHKTGLGNDNDRHSAFPMIQVHNALDMIFKAINQDASLRELLDNSVARFNIPPFRASIKDGYAMKSTGFSGTKKVVGFVAAGDEMNTYPLQEDECFKINTGAPVPCFADCVVQVEDTKLLRRNESGEEDLVEILIEPEANLDIRPIGCDISQGSKLFPTHDYSDVVVKSVLASAGEQLTMKKPRIAIISTGSELLAVGQPATSSKIYDSNTTMLEQLLKQFGYECNKKVVLSDDFGTLERTINEVFASAEVVICSGGVSMGDKDYVKPVLERLGFHLHFGRVNMKPGKPMTFASKNQKFFFGLPGNPVSAFVTFHVFVLPSIRWANGWPKNKCTLPRLRVLLKNESVRLDPRPEYVRATLTSASGRLYAEITGNQMSSRLQSIVGADCLVQLPAGTASRPFALAEEIFDALILRSDFISKYE